MPYPIGLWPSWVHLTFEVLAYAIAFGVFTLLRKNDPVDGYSRSAVIGACIAGATIGAKLAPWLDDPVGFLQGLNDPILLVSKKTIAGALVGGLIGVELVKRMIGITAKTGDLFVYPLCIAIFIGRIGCFLCSYEDQTFGTSTALPWGVNFGDGILRHPTQVYEMVFLAGLAVFLWRRDHHAQEPGQRFAFFMIGYFMFRFWVEFIKPMPHLYLGLNGIQLLSLAVLVYYRRELKAMVAPLWGQAKPGAQSQ